VTILLYVLPMWCFFSVWYCKAHWSTCVV